MPGHHVSAFQPRRVLMMRFCQYFVCKVDVGFLLRGIDINAFILSDEDFLIHESFIRRVKDKLLFSFQRQPDAPANSDQQIQHTISADPSSAWVQCCVWPVCLPPDPRVHVSTCLFPGLF